MTQYVYRFGGGVSDGDETVRGNKNVLGGKGANLDGMASIGLPVPPGFTITTEMCTAYYANGQSFPDSVRDEVANGLAHIENVTGRSFGDPANPLLVSVRSGARVSMPGMMDTVLNLGLNDDTVEGLATSSGDARFAWDSYRRFIQMYADVVLELDHGAFEEALEIAKEDNGYYLDTELSADDLKALVAEYKRLVEAEWGKPFPQDVHDQLWGAVGAVFGSWESDRAKVYRRLNSIPGDWGTAVNVQAMVFGNMGETSATGVAFTRDPATGENAYYGEYLINAQGEDVVAGIRTPQYLTRDAREKAGAKPLSDGRSDAWRVCRTSARVRHPRNALSRHAGYRIHRRAREALDAANPLGQAHREGGVADCGRYGRGGDDYQGRGGAARRSDGARSVAAPDARSGGRARCADQRACQPHPARHRARSCSTPTPPKNGTSGARR